MALKADLVESAPRTQGQIMNQMSGSGVSKPRPASKSPGGPRDRGASRGREKTKTPNDNKDTKSPSRSQSGAHECWTCHEVVQGDHFGYNCPKGDKKEGEERRAITPYLEGTDQRQGTRRMPHKAMRLSEDSVDILGTLDRDPGYS